MFMMVASTYERKGKGKIPKADIVVKRASSMMIGRQYERAVSYCLSHQRKYSYCGDIRIVVVTALFSVIS